MIKSTIFWELNIFTFDYDMYQSCHKSKALLGNFWIKDIPLGVALIKKKCRPDSVG